MNGQIGAFKVEDMCRALDVNKSGFYRWKRTGLTPRARYEKEVLVPKVMHAFKDSRDTYGCIRIGKALKDDRINTSCRRIRRIMEENHLVPRRVKSYKCTTKSSGKPKNPDLLNRNFTAAAINQIWVTDITQIDIKTGPVYLAVIMDLCSRYVVGWDVRAEITDTLVINALSKAIMSRTPAAGFIVHSDHGSQYTSRLFAANVRLHGGIQSMGSIGDCFDNASAESFNAIIKGDCLDHEIMLSLEHAEKVIFDYIEVFYNRKRKHSSIGYNSPAQFEKTLGV
jgi:putative transposase